MAIYNYICEDEKGEGCENSKASIEIMKPMSEATREEFCPICKGPMKKIFSSFGLKTFGDGYKS